MIEVYYYIPAEEANDAVECGLKLSKWFEKEVRISGKQKKCISAFLNPRDHPEKFKSTQLKCLKLEIPPQYCFIGDKYLYQLGVENAEVMERYEKSIIPAKQYIFGTYRLPECLIICTVIPGQITKLEKKLDTPILYSNSEEIYINCLIENFREGQEDFNDTVLYCFYSMLSDRGIYRKTEDEEMKMALFIAQDGDESYIIKMPDFKTYER